MVRSADAHLLDLIGEVVGVLELPELREALLVALDRAVPSDFVSINEVGPSPTDMQSVIQPAVPERLHQTWAELGHENPLIERFARTRDSRPYRFSDVVSRRVSRAGALPRVLRPARRRVPDCLRRRRLASALRRHRAQPRRARLHRCRAAPAGPRQAVPDPDLSRRDRIYGVAGKVPLATEGNSSGSLHSD